MSQKKLNRRDFLRYGLAAASGLALSACTGAAAPGGSAPAAGEPTTAPADASEAPPQSEGKTISYWTFWNQYANAVKVFESTL